MLAASWTGLQHLMGRDRSRAWRNETLGYRLPVRHGARHGIGSVALGHVFLESALLVSALRCNRMLFREARDSLDALADLVPRSIRQARQLRDLAWPLVQLELGLTLMDRRGWGKAADALISALSRVHDGSTFDLRENRLPSGGTSLDLWLVAGLLLPALDASVARGSKAARSLRSRIETCIRALPSLSRGTVTRYVRSREGRWIPSRAIVDATYRAWLLEGLRSRKQMPTALRSRRRRLLSELPGQAWDPATRLAFLLRWPHLRSQLR